MLFGNQGVIIKPMDKFTSHSLVKHSDCLDLHLYVTEVLEETAKSVKLKVYFCNHNKSLLYWETVQEVVISKNQMHKWRRVL